MRRDPSFFVMPGFDPGIHPSSKKMDCRVKPGNDGEKDELPSSGGPSRILEAHIG
jgi:hypothetical protein